MDHSPMNKQQLAARSGYPIEVKYVDDGSEHR